MTSTSEDTQKKKKKKRGGGGGDKKLITSLARFGSEERTWRGAEGAAQSVLLTILASPL